MPKCPNCDNQHYRIGVQCQCGYWEPEYHDQPITDGLDHHHQQSMSELNKAGDLYDYTYD